jgi:hypothetical protein
VGGAGFEQRAAGGDVQARGGIDDEHRHARG